MRILEFFGGIGGFASAVDERATSITAFDIHRTARTVYELNFPHEVRIAELCSILPAKLGDGADLWWMSPPCEPYTRQGWGRDDQDPRARAFHHLISHLAEIRPPHFAMENVPPFASSRSRTRLLEILDKAGYRWQEATICPTQFGIPNRRHRYYLIASRESGRTLKPLGVSVNESRPLRPLAAFLDADWRHWSAPEDSHLPRFGKNLHVVRRSESNVVTRCFTSAYGKSVLRSGSYLWVPVAESLENGRNGQVEYVPASISGDEPVMPQIAGRLRHFSPTEQLRLLGFQRGFQLPGSLTNRQAWSLIGNSLSVPVVRHVLKRLLPELMTHSILDETSDAH